MNAFSKLCTLSALALCGTVYAGPNNQSTLDQLASDPACVRMALMDTAGSKDPKAATLTGVMVSDEVSPSAQKFFTEKNAKGPGVNIIYFGADGKLVCESTLKPEATIYEQTKAGPVAVDFYPAVLSPQTRELLAYTSKEPNGSTIQHLVDASTLIPERQFELPRSFVEADGKGGATRITIDSAANTYTEAAVPVPPAAAPTAQVYYEAKKDGSAVAISFQGDSVSEKPIMVVKEANKDGSQQTVLIDPAKSSIVKEFAGPVDTPRSLIDRLASFRSKAQAQPDGALQPATFTPPKAK